jgi:PilZ domain
MMSERRGSIRQKSFLRGCVYFNKRRSAVDCLIRDISDDGARIVFSEAVSVPDVVELYIPQKEQMLRSRVQWRHGDEIGLAFGDALAGPGDPVQSRELAERVAALETELAALKRMVKRLRSEVEGGDTDAA